MPPEVRIDKGYVARSAAVAALCLAGAGGLVVWGSQDGGPSTTFGFALVASIIIAWVSIFWVIVKPYFFVYYCPTCRRQLPRTKPPMAARYHCDDCNIVWDLFLRPGESM